MSDPMNTPDARLDSQMIADIRRARSKADDDERWSIRLTLGEVDALLRAVDARDDAIRRLVGDDEPDLPKPVRVSTYASNTGGDGIEVDMSAPNYPPETISDGSSPASEAAWTRCRYCEGPITRRTSDELTGWRHVQLATIVGHHPAEPITEGSITIEIDELNPCPMCGRPRPVGPYGPYCLACE